MSAHVMSGRSFTFSFQFSTNVYGSGKTVPSAVISFSSYFFLSSLFKFEEYFVADVIALIRDAAGKFVLFLLASNMWMRNESLQNVNIGTGLLKCYCC